MKTSYQIWISAVIMTVILSATACKKNNKNEDSPGAGQDGMGTLLVNKKWDVTAATISPAVDVNGDGVPDTDLYALAPDCEKKDYTSFKADGSYTIWQECTKTFMEPGTWVLYNGDKIRFTHTVGTYEAKVITLTDNTFKIEYQDVINGKTVTVTKTYGKK